MVHMDGFRRVAPARPAAGYIGGKKQLAGRIAAKIEAARHTTYAEPFVGMGGVFLRRRFAPQSEVINDLSGDVATFFRILQRHYAAFMDMLKYQLTDVRSSSGCGQQTRRRSLTSKGRSIPLFAENDFWRKGRGPLLRSISRARRRF